MTEYMPLIYDGAVLLIMAASVLIGYKRGILRTAAGLVCTAVAFALASYCSSYAVTEKVYDRYFSERFRSRISTAADRAKEKAELMLREQAEEIIDSYVEERLGGSEDAKAVIKGLGELGGNAFKDAAGKIFAEKEIDIDGLLTIPAISGKIKEIASAYSEIAAAEISRHLPDGIEVSPAQMEKVMSDTGAYKAFLCEMLGIRTPDGQDNSLTDYIERTVVRPAALRMLSMIIWAVVFAVSGAVLRIIAAIVLSIRSIKAIAVCDSAAGAAMGAAAGAAAVFAAVFLIMLFVKYTGGTDNINGEIFSQTVIFGKIYRLAAGLDVLPFNGISSV